MDLFSNKISTKFSLFLNICLIMIVQYLLSNYLILKIKAMYFWKHIILRYSRSQISFSPLTMANNYSPNIPPRPNITFIVVSESKTTSLPLNSP